MSEDQQNPSEDKQTPASKEVTDKEAKSEPKQPEKEKTAAKPAPAKPAAAKKEEAEEPAPEPGKYGRLLEGKNIPVTHLGPDGMGTEMIQVEAEHLLNAAAILKDDPGAKFDLLVSVSGVDMKDHRVSVTHLYSLDSHDKLAIKTPAGEDDTVPSLMPVWPAADWHERESYDLMGITYEGHPDLRRILMPVDWIGHPLRKDYVENDPRLVWNRR